MDKMSQKLEKTKEVGVIIQNEVARAAREKTLPEKFSQIDETVYRDACDYLGENILSSALLMRELQFLKSNRTKLKVMAPAGTKICLAVVPTTPMGIPFDDDQIKKDNYFQSLLRSDIDGLTYNFAAITGCYFELMPEKIGRPISESGCSFDVSYQNGNSELIEDEDFNSFYNAYIDSFNNLRGFFGLPALNIEKLK